MVHCPAYLDVMLIIARINCFLFSFLYRLKRLHRRCPPVFRLLFVLLLPGLSRADSCDIELQYGILITPEHIRISDRHFTRVQINHDEQLFIDGDWISLERHEEALLKSFSQGLRTEVPQIVGIAMEGAEIGLLALDRIVSGIADSGDDELFRDELEGFRSRFRQKFNHFDDKFYIAPQSLDKLNEFFKDELGQQVKEVLTGSLGAVLIALNEAINFGAGSQAHERVDVSEQLARLEAKIEQQLSAKSLILERKALQFCERLTELNQTESELQLMVPKLRAYDVVKLKD